MSKILVQLQKGVGTLPTGVTFDHTQVDVTDSAAVKQSFSLNGSETPPWSVTVDNVADGAGAVTATDIDSTGALLGSPQSQTFTAGTVTPPSTFPSTTGITVTQA